jgi:hypothetical protein
MFRQPYPRMYRIHFGTDSGCVLIQWEERGEYLLVRPNGSVSWRMRPPDMTAVRVIRRRGEDGGEVA